MFIVCPHCDRQIILDLKANPSSLQKKRDLTVPGQPWMMFTCTCIGLGPEYYTEEEWKEEHWKRHRRVGADGKEFWGT